MFDTYCESEQTSTKTRRQVLAACGAVVAVGVAGCSEGDDGTPAGTPTGTPAGTPTGTSSGSATTVTPTDTRETGASAATATSTDSSTATPTETATASQTATPARTATPSPTATPATPDRLEVDHTMGEDQLSRWWQFSVAETSEFSVEFDVTSDCQFDVFVLTDSQLQTYTDHVEGDTDYRSFARDTAPPEVAFFDSGGGSGATDLPAEDHNLVFHRRCDSRQTDEFEFTAEVGAGQFDD